MIIVRIHGGLGNQLFQYAFGLYLKKKLNLTDVYFNSAHYVGDIDRPLSIKKLNLLNFNLVESGFRKFKMPKLNKAYNLFFNYNQYYIEGLNFFRNDFLPKNFKPDKNYYFDGYWQKIRIINDVEFELRDQINFNVQISDSANNIIHLIKKTKNSVSVHIRKTDFITENKNKSIFSDCNIDYYYRAFNYLLESLNKEFTLFIFSDDFNWVKSNLKIAYKYFLVEGNSDYEDLYLMSCCDHNITANSTFSWWAAWLNNSNNKIVITPEKWFENDLNENDFVPDTWIRISNK